MTENKEDYLSFEQALDALKLKEEELKRLVSEGEIRAFRQGDTMRLRRADVDNLRSELSGGEVVDLGENAPELVFEDEGDLQAGMATEEITEVETIVDEPAAETVTDEAAETVIDDEVEAEPEPVAVVEEEGIPEGALTLVAAVLAAVVMLVALPVVISISRGESGAFAESIAGLLK
ncbi:MAG: DNA-binding protein [Planctomycetota bacterium]|nr:MAG: DNA-binding protein [Planctomycetota bacterium]